jgi:hypothetical protein
LIRNDRGDFLRPLVRLAVLAAALSVAACSNTSHSAPEPFNVPMRPAAPTSTAQTPEEEALFGPRVELPGGMLQKQLGKVAQWGGPNDTDPNTWGVRMVIDKIEIDPVCDEYMPEPERGHRLVLSIRVETSAAFQPSLDDGPHFYRWSTIGPDGVTEGPLNSGGMCHPAADLPFDMRPSAKYRGEVVLDTANTAGQLVFENMFVYNISTTI